MVDIEWLETRSTATLTETMRQLKPIVEVFSNITGIPEPEATSMFRRMLTMHASPSPVLGERRTSVVLPVTPFNKAVAEALRDFTEHTQYPERHARAEFARRLGETVSFDITTGKIKNWTRGSVPKAEAHRVAVLNGIARVVAAAAVGATVEASTFVTGEDIRSQITRWRGTGLSDKQIRLAGEISAAEFASWQMGATHRIKRARFEAIQQKVAYWVAQLEARGHLETVNQQDIQSKLAHWRACGLSDQQIRAAGQVSPRTFAAWQEGTATVLKLEFERAALLVEAYLTTVRHD